MKLTDEKTQLYIIALLKAYKIRYIIGSPGTTNASFNLSIQQDNFFSYYSFW